MIVRGHSIYWHFEAIIIQQRTQTRDRLKRISCPSILSRAAAKKTEKQLLRSGNY